MKEDSLSLRSDGYFYQGQRRFIPVGVNYWPASCGVEMWPAWPEEEMRHDLDVLKNLGLNTIRFFLRWQDFEPEPGKFNPVMFDRLKQFLGWCRDRKIFAHPSLFVGFMSGGIFWPKWKNQRNVFADPFMLERSRDFAAKCAAEMALFHSAILAVDQGNELCCLPDSQTAPPEAVIQWCKTVNEAIRSNYPKALIISGNEQNQVVNDTGWRFGDQPGVDLYSMHSYPVPAWHTIAFDGMTDSLCQSLLPFYTKIARSYGPVMAQEFGTIVTFGEKQQDRYLRAMLPKCWEAGANGFLWWCMRDITARVHPYLKNDMESSLGLVGSNDQVKPGLGYFLEFSKSLNAVDDGGKEISSNPEEKVGLYLPRHYYNRNNPSNPGNDPKQFSAWLVAANFILEQLGHEVCIVRGDQDLREDVQTILIPGVFLGREEIEKFEAWVKQGGALVWHGPDPVNWAHASNRLLGVRSVDYRGLRKAEVSLFGQGWTFSSYPRNTRLEIEADTAKVLARDQWNLPVVILNEYGRGSVIVALPQVEQAVCEVSHHPEERVKWHEWYRGMLTIAKDR